MRAVEIGHKLGVIAIGRNEGERLKRCIGSAPAFARLVYVDSGSTDRSVQWSHDQQVDVIELETTTPFTAARARNAGFHRLLQANPDIEYVQFVDGDCELVNGWTERAASFLDANPQVGAVSGRLRERYPDRSIYNWMCDREWEAQPGESRSIGGIVMIRSSAFQAVGGYRDDMIAGEEPELAVRLRAAGWRIWRLDDEMALHDAAITRFRQWWRRTVRTGYAFALGAHLHGASPDRHWVWESQRAWIWGIWLPLCCLGAGLALGPWGWSTFLIYPLQLIRQVGRHSGSLRQRVTLALFQLLSRFPEAIGQLKFMRDRLLGYRARTIEYK